ncbi:hypothetical protein Bhyg_05901 [Pseudolycoriella hygida]|uniref:Uncharacterized protein n=1 Tax=Pseudolycoriella hygida TaxID=35572 RepID=A0A9Q0MZJ6_9DIPT|nr:hypothetical protein Bhyg_05901 [Pseudolycoriella hygida]
MDVAAVANRLRSHVPLEQHTSTPPMSSSERINVAPGSTRFIHESHLGRWALLKCTIKRNKCAIVLNVEIRLIMMVYSCMMVIFTVGGRPGHCFLLNLSEYFNRNV